MVKIKLKYLVEDLDRHGNVRLYVRVPGRKKIRIRGVPGTNEFMNAYSDAIAANNIHDKRAKYKVPSEGSFGHICLKYFSSETFMALDISTQKWRRRSLNEICEHHGDKPIVQMRANHVRKLRDEIRGKPGAARNRLKALKALFAWAMEEELAAHDPTHGVKPVKYVSTPHHTWTIDEISKFEETFPVGTKPRDALIILLYTGGRREDAVRLGPRHIQNDRVIFRQAKNEHRNPIEIDIPIHLDLAEIASRTPAQNTAFLMTEYGKPFTPNGFGTPSESGVITPDFRSVPPMAFGKPRLHYWQNLAPRHTRLCR